MATVVRVIAWSWMLAGFAAIAMFVLGRPGALPAARLQEVALALAFPWSLVIDFLRLGSRTAILAMLAGVFINGQILLVASHILDD